MINNESHGFLGLMPEEDRKRIMARAKQLKFRGKKSLFLKGDPGEAFYIILAGSVIISINSPEGKEVILNKLSAGDVFGEISMLDQAARTADAYVMTGTELLSIDRTVFMEFLDTYPVFYKSIIALLCKRLRRFSEHVESFSLANSLERLVTKLISLVEMIPHDQKVLIEISQSDLAKMLSLSREVVNKNLKILQDKNLLKVERKKIFVLNREELYQFQKSMVI